MMSNSQGPDGQPNGTGKTGTGRGILPRLAVLACIATAVFAVAGLLGYIPGLRLLGSMSPDYHPMSPGTAICLLIFSFILLSQHRVRRPYFLPAATGLALLVIIFCLLGITGQLTGRDLNFEQRLFPVTDTVHGIPVGRMSPATGAALIFTGVAIILLLWSRRYPDTRWMRNWASCLGGLTAFISFIFLTGYLRGTPYMYSGSTIPMATTTSVALLFLGSALTISVPPDTFPLRLVTGDATPARLLRGFLPLIAVIVFIGIMAPRWVLTPAEEHPGIVAFVLTISLLAAIAAAALLISSSLGKSLEQANAKVRQSEQKASLLIEKGGDGIIVLQDGLIKFANSKAAEITGLPKEDALGKPFIDYVAPQYREMVIDRYRRRLAGEAIPDRYEMELLHKNGSVIPVEVNASLIEYDGKTATLSMVRDITERKRIEAKLKDSETRYRRLFETAQDAILILDGDTGQIIDANPFIKDLLGLSLEELLGKNLWEIGEFKDTLAGKISYQELYESGYKRWDNLPLVARDGRIISVEVVANSYQVDHQWVIQCNIRDMTESHLARAALNEANQDLEVAQRLTRIGNWKWTIATNKTTWSKELCHINGWDPNLPVPPFAEMERFYTPEGWKRLNALVANALNTGEPYECELEQISTDGTRIITFSRGEADYDASGKIIGLHGTVQDITERKQAEEALQTKTKELDKYFYEALDLLCIADTDGYFRRLNKEWEKCLGYKLSELEGHRFLDFVHPDDMQATLEAISQLDAQNQVLNFTNRYRCKDGSYRWLDWRSHSIGKEIYAVARDVTELKKAKDKLQFLYQHQETILTAVPDIIMEVNNNKIYTWANQAGLNFFGEDVIGKEAAFYFEGEQQTYQKVQPVFGGTPEAIYVESRQRRKDGAIRLLAWWCCSLKDQKGNVIGALSAAQDITERKRAEEALKLRAERHRSILATALDGYWLVDKKGRLLEANESYSRMSGYSIEELLSMRIADLETVESASDVAARMEKITGQGRERFLSQHRRKNGSVFDVEVSAQYRGPGVEQFVVFLRDITEIKRAEQEIKTSSANFKALFESTADAISIINVHDFTIVSANEAFLKQAGVKEEQVIGKTCYAITHALSAPCTPPHNPCPLKDTAISGQHSVAEHIHFAENGDKRRKYVEVSTTPLKDGSGKVVQVIHVSRDLTERRKLMEQLIAQDRLSSIGELVAGIAHEINNPLTSVIGFSELLLKRELPADIKEDLGVIVEEAKRTSAIVRNLLCFARQQPQEKHAFDINEPLQTALRIRSHEQSVNNIKVNANLTRNLPWINGNISQLQQVFFNIIVNAEQAMIEAHNKGTLTIATEQAGNCIRVSFADDGPGIGPDNMKKLFTPFFTTKGVGGGTGLGLSVSHGIIAEHGGTIEVESEMGKGATFIVELPVSKPA